MTKLDPAADVRSLVERFVAALDPLLQRAVLEQAVQALAVGGLGAAPSPVVRRKASKSSGAPATRAAKPLAASSADAAPKSTAPKAAAAKASTPKSSKAKAPTARPLESKSRSQRGPSFSELESAGQSIVAYVAAHPEARVTEVRRALAISNDKVWRLATKVLTAGGKLAIRGEGSQAAFARS